MAIPLHLPTAKLRAAAYPTIRSMLRNHRRVEQWWNLEDVDSLPCCCRWIRTHSCCDFSDSEHLAVALEDLDLPSQLITFKSTNANSTYFFSRQPFLICFPLDLTVGHNSMAFHRLQMQKSGDLSTNNGKHIQKKYIVQTDFRFRKSQAFATMVAPFCCTPSCRSWTSKTDCFLS